MKIFVAGGLDGFPVYVAPDFVSAQEALRCLNDLTGGGFVYIPYNEDTLLFRQGTGRLRMEINSALDKILSGARGAVLAADALAARYPDRNAFERGRRTLKREIRCPFLFLRGFFRKTVSNAFPRWKKRESFR